MAKQQQRKDTRFSSVEKRIHKHGVGFLVYNNKDIVNTVMGCRPVSSRLITICVRAVPFNIKMIQVYAPKSDYDDNELELQLPKNNNNNNKKGHHIKNYNIDTIQNHNLHTTNNN